MNVLAIKEMPLQEKYDRIVDAFLLLTATDYAVHKEQGTVDKWVDKWMKTQIEMLPNLGEEMARSLQQAGIHTPGDLKQIGRIEAAILISPHKRSGHTCYKALCVLEGATRGIRWHLIPKTERDELWNQYQLRNKGYPAIDIPNA